MTKELRDQSAHAAAAFLILALASIGNAFTFALAGLAMGMIREVTEEGNPVTLQTIKAALFGSPLDLTFWTLGGFIAGLVFAT